ncbi:SRR1-domain-containing protein [Metschnikowia bicuspidata var. bicuspidata NRRL YB-4993]|uniref:SRR1-domain-containing protein n=1 Tax=Metschnikowia bicuspidata var. bicuspidata NRRL YB-4993 TaxID=869754 RepID=A0A1A0HAK3_9ASCO|nr:SRR1-domain-containing protein [Metschnikowia bicuspidata var. bicuspidata NRRL YB-4993]OBA21041.1 SRR1-domain-containing protein [Metschnikowia bicuspidata var. bicuspidata NRRL YB-4993]
MESTRFESLAAKLQKHEQCVAQSDLYTHTVTLLRPLKFTMIRCLALGSPTQEFQALYQLAYLKLLASSCNIEAKNISCYDPAFLAEDTQFLANALGYVVEAPEEYCPGPETTGSTLYYMPHAPRTLTESVLAQHRPRWLLANDFSVTMGTLTKARFLQECPTLATLVHLFDQNTAQKLAEPAQEDGFVRVVSRKRRSRPRKNVYVEPELEYDVPGKYFRDVHISRIKADAGAPWRDSFSDLALNVVVPKEKK